MKPEISPTKKDEKMRQIIKELAMQFIQRESNQSSMITVTGVHLIDHPDRAHVIVDQAVSAAALHKRGAFKGVVNAITNAPEDAADVVDELIAHPKTRRINFTGSTRVGRIIAEKSGAHLKRAGDVDRIHVREEA